MNRLFSLCLLVFFASCANQPKTAPVKVEPVKLESASVTGCGAASSKSCAGCPEAAKEGVAVVVGVDSVQKNPVKYFDKTISLQGRVIHTCKVSGKKMFLAGSDENSLIRINAGENISRFDESLQGEIVVAKGILTPVTEVSTDKEADGKIPCVTEAKSQQYVMMCSEFEVVSKTK